MMKNVKSAIKGFVPYQNLRFFALSMGENKMQHILSAGNLLDDNGNLCESGYATKDSCKKGIQSLAKWAETADVVKIEK